MISGNRWTLKVDTVGNVWFTKDMTNTASATHHQNAGHEVLVTCGVVRCLDCETVLDTSGHRPGLVEANQWR